MESFSCAAVLLLFLILSLGDVWVVSLVQTGGVAPMPYNDSSLMML